MHKITVGAVAVMLAAGMGVARAGQYCTETVTQAISHSNGNVYFKTDKSCSGGWCLASYANAEVVKRSYALLLAAVASGKTVDFYWPNASTPCAVQAVYSIPEMFGMNK